MQIKQFVSLMTTVLRWILSIIALVLFVRLGVTLFNLVFNFSETPIGRFFSDVTFVERITTVNLYSLAVQITITTVIVTLVIIAEKVKRNSYKKPAAANRDPL